MNLKPVNFDPFATAQPTGPVPAQGMPGAAPKLRPVDFNPFAEFSAADLPTVGGPLGFSGEFQQATGAGNLSAFKPALADMFGSYQDVANALQKVAPGAKVVKDAKGYEVLELPDGKRFAMNKPGVQGHEVASLTGNILSFIPAGRLVRTLGGGSLLGRAALAAPASAATDAVLQKVAGREEIDPVRMAITAAGGSVGELVAPALGKLADMTFQRAKAFFTSPQKAAQEAAKVLQEAGVQSPSNGMVNAILKRWDEVAAGIDPKTIAAEADTGVKLTRGQKTGDYGALRREEMLRQSDTLAGSKIREVDRGNLEALQNWVEKMRTGFGGKSGTVSDSFDRVGETVRGAYEGAKANVNALYERVGQSNAFVNAKSIRDLPGMLKQSVRDWPVDEVMTPSAKRALDMIKGEVGKLPDEVSAVSLRAVETMRRRLNNAIGTAGNQSDKAALQQIKGTFDSWFDSLDSAIVKGEKGAVDLVKQARAARADMGARFEARGAGDGRALIERMIQGNATGQELAEAAFGVAQTGKANAVQFIRAAKRALPSGPKGEMNPVFGELKSAYLQKLTIGKNGEMLGPQAILGNIKTALNTRKDVLKELYSPEEIARLERATQVLDALVPKGMVGRSSGTAERAYAYLEILLKGVPFGGQLLGAMQAPGRAVAAAQMYQPIRAPGVGDALGMPIGASVAEQNQR